VNESFIVASLANSKLPNFGRCCGSAFACGTGAKEFSSGHYAFFLSGELRAIERHARVIHLESRNQGPQLFLHVLFTV